MTWEKFGKGAFGFAVFIVGIVLKGWVLTMLWAWFVAGTFNLPLLTTPNAAGLVLVVRYTTLNINATTKEESFPKQAFTTIAFPLIALGFGWVIRWWMLGF